MKIAIIGAGFGGLSAGYKLAKEGFDVTIFESDARPGGLAIGFKEPEWKWSLESHYHHWFISDWAVRNLATEIGHKVIVKRPKTSTFVAGKIYQLDSPMSLMLFSELPLLERLRTGLIIACMKMTSNWKPLEKVTAEKFLKKYMGETSWKVLWEPLFKKKFGEFAASIPASWFWSRIKKRSSSLVYPEGGFFAFARNLDKAITRYKGRIYYSTKVEKISKKDRGIFIKTSQGTFLFDRVICTLPTPLFLRITEGLPDSYLAKLINLKGIGAINLVLSLKQPFLQDGSYWLNINAVHFPFLAVVEHTNFMDKNNYNNENLVYVGSYLPHDHPYFRKEAADLLRDYYPFLKTINPKFDKSWLKKAYLFKAPFAQPIIPLNYSESIPPFKTPVEGLYLCNIQQVYPWDRGTNYAVELGEKVADLLIKES